MQDRRKARWALCLVLGAGATTALAGAWSDAVGAAEPACAAVPHILACFKAYKTTLRPFHLPQLAAIVDEIAASFVGPEPLNVIWIRGAAATWKKTDPVWLLGAGRALAVRVELEKRLRDRKVDLSKMSIVSMSLANGWPMHSDETRGGRALNRRVEILMLHRKPPPPPPRKDGCVPDEPLRDALRALVPIAPDLERRDRITCLRDLFAEHFDCGRTIDPSWEAPTMDDRAAGIVERFRAGRHAPAGPIAGTGCAGKTGAKLEACLNSLDVDILFTPNVTIGKAIDKWGSEAPKKDFRKSDECTIAARILEKSKSPNSVYSCYEGLMDALLWPCVRSDP